MTTLSKEEILKRFDKFALLAREGKVDGINAEMNWWLVNPISLAGLLAMGFSTEYRAVLGCFSC